MVRGGRIFHYDGNTSNITFKLPFAAGGRVLLVFEKYEGYGGGGMIPVAICYGMRYNSGYPQVGSLCGATVTMVANYSDGTWSGTCSVPCADVYMIEYVL